MTDITPPPELVQQWCHDRDRWVDFENVLAIRAAQWGYLQHEKALLDAMHATELPPS